MTIFLICQANLHKFIQRNVTITIQVQFLEQKKKREMGNFFEKVFMAINTSLKMNVLNQIIIYPYKEHLIDPLPDQFFLQVWVCSLSHEIKD